VVRECFIRKKWCLWRTVSKSKRISHDLSPHYLGQKYDCMADFLFQHLVRPAIAIGCSCASQGHWECRHLRRKLLPRDFLLKVPKWIPWKKNTSGQIDSTRHLLLCFCQCFSPGLFCSSVLINLLEAEWAHQAHNAWSQPHLPGPMLQERVREESSESSERFSDNICVIHAPLVSIQESHFLLDSFICCVTYCSIQRKEYTRKYKFCIPRTL
jgi:hypothetical protein